MLARKYVVCSLDVLTTRYSVNMTINGTLDFSVVDYNGAPIDATIKDGVVSFTLDDDMDMVSVIGSTEQTNVTVVYKASKVADNSANPGNSSAGDASPGDESAASSRGAPFATLFVALLFLI